MRALAVTPAQGVSRPLSYPLADAITAALGGGCAAIIDDAGQQAPYVTFTRSSTATYYGSDGLLKTASANEPRYDYDPVTLQLRGLLLDGAASNPAAPADASYFDGLRDRVRQVARAKA